MCVYDLSDLLPQEPNKYSTFLAISFSFLKKPLRLASGHLVSTESDRRESREQLDCRLDSEASVSLVISSRDKGNLKIKERREWTLLPSPSVSPSRAAEHHHRGTREHILYRKKISKTYEREVIRCLRSPDVFKEDRAELASSGPGVSRMTGKGGKDHYSHGSRPKPELTLPLTT